MVQDAGLERGCRTDGCRPGSLADPEFDGGLDLQPRGDGLGGLAVALGQDEVGVGRDAGGVDPGGREIRDGGVGREGELLPRVRGYGGADGAWAGAFDVDGAWGDGAGDADDPGDVAPPGDAGGNWGRTTAAMVASTSSTTAAGAAVLRGGPGSRCVSLGGVSLAGASPASPAGTGVPISCAGSSPAIRLSDMACATMLCTGLPPAGSTPQVVASVAPCAGRSPRVAFPAMTVPWRLIALRRCPPLDSKEASAAWVVRNRDASAGRAVPPAV